MLYVNCALAVVWLLVFCATVHRGTMGWSWYFLVISTFYVGPGLKVIKLAYSLKLKIKRIDCLLADACVSNSK